MDAITVTKEAVETAREMELVGPNGRIAQAIERAKTNPNALADRLSELMGRRVYASTTNPWVQKGGSPPTARFLVWLPEALDVNGDWLLTGGGEMQRPTAEERATHAHAERYRYIKAYVFEVEGVIGDSAEGKQRLTEEGETPESQGATPPAGSDQHDSGADTE